MKPSIGSKKTLWSELFPHEFKRRLAENPTVYLPLGLCEPHGQVSALGLDLLKAEWICRETAERSGGIVAPSLGYHIHETGYHARWLEDEVGEENPHMTGIPPAVMITMFLYQLRAFVNAGFRAVVAVTGHGGGNQEDLRRAADAFMKHVPANVFVSSDPELVEGRFAGDHAGKFEISQLMYIRPDLVDLTLAALENVPGSGGRLALAADAAEASAEHGRHILQACVERLCVEAERLKSAAARPVDIGRIPYESVEAIREEALREAAEWKTSKPWPGQKEVSAHSQWKPYEFYQG